MSYVKYIFSVVCGAVLSYFRLYGIAFTVVAIAVLFDIITGVLASVMDGTGLSSERAYKGVIKKAVLFLALGFGTFLDAFLPYAAQAVNLDTPKSMLFSSVICVYITVTECISVIENIYRCNNRALPEWIVKLLRTARDDIDRGGDSQ